MLRWRRIRVSISVGIELEGMLVDIWRIKKYECAGVKENSKKKKEKCENNGVRENVRKKTKKNRMKPILLFKRMRRV
jgi:hypothetical protein